MHFDRHSLYVAIVMAMALVALLNVKDSAAQSNICTEDDGTAECVAPEVTGYHAGSTGVPGSTGPLSGEARAIASVVSAVLASSDVCSSSFQYLPWLPLPVGATYGSRVVGDADSDYRIHNDNKRNDRRGTV